MCAIALSRDAASIPIFFCHPCQFSFHRGGSVCVHNMVVAAVSPFVSVPREGREHSQGAHERVRRGGHTGKSTCCIGSSPSRLAYESGRQDAGEPQKQSLRQPTVQLGVGDTGENITHSYRTNTARASVRSANRSPCVHESSGRTSGWTLQAAVASRVLGIDRRNTNLALSGIANVQQLRIRKGCPAVSAATGRNGATRTTGVRLLDGSPSEPRRSRVHAKPRQDGYVVTMIASKNYLVHRLVATSFLPLPLHRIVEVNHKDGDPQTIVRATEWCTKQKREAFVRHQHGARDECGTLGETGAGGAKTTRRGRCIREALTTRRGPRTQPGTYPPCAWGCVRRRAGTCLSTTSHSRRTCWKAERGRTWSSTTKKSMSVCTCDFGIACVMQLTEFQARAERTFTRRSGRRFATTSAGDRRVGSVRCPRPGDYVGRGSSPVE